MLQTLQRARVRRKTRTSARIASTIATAIPTDATSAATVRGSKAEITTIAIRVTAKTMATGRAGTTTARGVATIIVGGKIAGRRS
jgi:hypothetical protein